MNPKTIGVIIVSLISVVSVGTEMRTSSRDLPSFEEYRVILERNMFSPRRGIDERKGEKAEQEQQQAEAAARASIKVVGIVRLDNSLSSIAILEEDGKHRMCRVGDTVGGMMILDIRSQEIVFNSPGGKWVAEIQPGTPSYRAVPRQADAATADEIGAGHAASGLVGRRVPIPKAHVPRLARSVKFVADEEGGAIKGLRLTEDFMGLKEGDRVTYVGRQSLRTSHPRQKLWQIAKKYGSCHEEMPEIQVVIERGGRELEFVLCPYS